MKTNNEKAIVVVAFPGCGKTYAKEHNTGLDIADSDSSNFSWEVINGERVRSENFPENYITHIKENMDKYDFIFVSSHEAVRKALKENGISYVAVLPEKDAKDEWIKRFVNRNDTQEFIDNMTEHWDEWLDQMKNKESNPSMFNVLLDGDEYLDEECMLFINTSVQNGVADGDISYDVKKH